MKEPYPGLKVENLAIFYDNVKNITLNYLAFNGQNRYFNRPPGYYIYIFCCNFFT